MEETCKGCRKWEEEMYWTHFQSIHFCQFLFGDFVEELTIPKKFANNLKDKLPETVTLKGPSGSTWNVGLTESGDALFFKNGWKEFVEDHSLEEDDVLFFTYNGNSHFDVLMFDHGSLCEKESSYFVRKCGHTRLDGGCKTMGKTKESSVEVLHASPHDDVGCTTSGRGKISRANRKVLKEAVKPLPAKSKLRSREPSTPSTCKGAKVNSDAEQNSINRNGTYLLQYVSNRRPITEEEKEKALQMARAASTSESFIVVMRPTCVYKRFYASIPSEWAASHLSTRHQDVILRVKENSQNTWRTRYYYTKHGGGGLTCGWKDFTLENNLEEFDVCMFELASQVDDTIFMDVSIYRVVEELTPLTRVNSAASRRGRQSKNGPLTRVNSAASRRGRPSKNGPLTLVNSASPRRGWATDPGEFCLPKAWKAVKNGPLTLVNSASPRRGRPSKNAKRKLR